MRPVEFAQEAIIEAGQELLTAGRNITGFALRQKVGGGNPSRLKQVWDEYINSRKETKSEPVAELPIEVAEELTVVTKTLSDRIAALALELNDKAVKAAEQRVAEVVRAAGEQREQAERELVDASQTVEDLEATLEEANNRIQGLESELANANAKAQAQAVELAQLQERLTLTEQAHQDQRKQAAEEARRMTERLTKAENQSQDLEKTLDEAHNTIQTRAVELAQLQERLTLTEQTHQDQRKQAAQEAHRVAERLMKVETERDNTRKEAAIAKEEVAKLRGQVEVLQIQSTDLMRALTAIEGEGKRKSTSDKGKTLEK